MKAKLVLISLSMLAATQASAAVITFGGQTPLDGSQQTSSFVPSGAWITPGGVSSGGAVTNIIDPASGFYIETFDQATQNPLLPAGVYGAPLPSWLEIQTAGCGVNSAGALSVSGTGGIGVQQGNTPQAAHDNANTTCFGYAPHYNVNPANASMVVDYTGFITQQRPGDYIGYLGIYYGSIDTYNALEFGNIVNNVFVPINFQLGNNVFNILTGTTILDIFQLQSGNRDNSNRYVNIVFNQNENFTAFRMTNTSSRAFEIDNIVVGLNSAVTVPAPASIGILGLGLVGLLLNRRRQKS